MSTLLKYLLAAKGERGLLGKIGQWRLAVSRNIDNLASSIAALLDPLFVEVKMIDGVQNIADLSAQTTVLLDTIISDGGVPYDPATGIYSLEANSTYVLEADLQFQGFGTVATDIARWRWVDTNGDTLPPGHRIEGKAVPPGSTQNLSGLSSARAIFRTTDAIGAMIVATGGQGSAAVSLGSYAIVRKIG